MFTPRHASLSQARLGLERKPGGGETCIRGRIPGWACGGGQGEGGEGPGGSSPARGPIPDVRLSVPLQLRTDRDTPATMMAI